MCRAEQRREVTSTFPIIDNTQCSVDMRRVKAASLYQGHCHLTTLKEETKQWHSINWPLIIVEDLHEHTRMHHPSILLTSMFTSLSKVV